MTIDKNRFVKIPVWLIAFTLPLLVGGISGYAASRFQDGKIEKQLEINTKALDSKMGIEVYDLMTKQLDRIETKIDQQEVRLDAIIR